VKPAPTRAIEQPELDADPLVVRPVVVEGIGEVVEERAADHGGRREAGAAAAADEARVLRVDGRRARDGPRGEVPDDEQQREDQERQQSRAQGDRACHESGDRGDQADFLIAKLAR
jgi:hypothetical protein